LPPSASARLAAHLRGDLLLAVGRAGVDDDHLAEEGLRALQAIGQDPLFVADDHAEGDVGSPRQIGDPSGPGVRMALGVEDDPLQGKPRQAGGEARLQVVAPLLQIELAVVAQEGRDVGLRAHERLRAGVMDEAARCDDEPVAGAAAAIGEIVVLVHAHAEALVEASDLVPNRPLDGQAEADEHIHVDVGHVAAGEVLGEEVERLQARVGGIDLLQMACAVGVRPGRGDRSGALQGFYEPRQAGPGYDGIAVEEEEDVAGRGLRALVACLSKAQVGLVADELDEVVLLGGQIRAVRRGVVDDNDFMPEVAAGAQALQAADHVLDAAVEGDYQREAPTASAPTPHIVFAK